MRRSKALHWFAVFSALWALLVISIGGLVTSKGVGMAVPDWPTTYGYNMFFFPIRLWEGGIFHEHLHRLVASALGLWTVILAVWLQVRDDRGWLRMLGWVAVAAVVGQGVLGGKRVQLNAVDVVGIPGSIFFGVLHAITAQLFLGILSVIVLATSSWWAPSAGPAVLGSRRGGWMAALACLTLLQLGIAATMRHQHAGLAIPDFPLAYGSLYPKTDPEALGAINQRRLGVIDDAPVTAFQIHLQMAHRGVAILLLGGGVALFAASRRDPRGWRVATGCWMALYLVQFGLGAATVWTNKAADIATAHVAVGAFTLASGIVLAVKRISVERQYRRAFDPCREAGSLLKNPAESVPGRAG